MLRHLLISVLTACLLNCYPSSCCLCVFLLVPLWLCCPADVSGKTSYLVVGEQCSRRKYEKVGRQRGEGCGSLQTATLGELFVATSAW